VGDGDGAPVVVPPARPSRPREAWSANPEGPVRTGVDVSVVDWDLDLPEAPVPLSRELLARWLAASGEAPVRPLAATSRAPGSRLNRAAPKLSSDLTAALEVRAATDDRGRVVVAARVSAGNRRARRVLDQVALEGGWVRRRGTASTTLRRVATPDGDRRVTALRTADAVSALLDRADWPLAGWTLTAPRTP
jgi:hypothetical protein